MIDHCTIYSRGLSRLAVHRDNQIAIVRQAYEDDVDLARIRADLCRRLGLETIPRRPDADCLAEDLHLIHVHFSECRELLELYAGVAYESGRAVILQGRWPDAEN